MTARKRAASAPEVVELPEKVLADRAQRRMAQERGLEICARPKCAHERRFHDPCSRCACPAFVQRRGSAGL